MNDTLGINNPLKKLLDGLFSGKGYLVKGYKQGWLATEIAFWVIEMIPFKLTHHCHGKHYNFRCNPLLPLHTTFNLKSLYIYIYKSALLSGLSQYYFPPALNFYPSLLLLRLSVQWLQLPGMTRTQTAEYFPGTLLSVFLPMNSWVEKKENSTFYLKEWR